MAKRKLIRLTTVPVSLAKLLRGQLRFMKDHYEVLAVSSDGELRKEVAMNEGVKVVPIEMTRTISPFKDLVATWRLYKLFRKEKPHIVHTHTPKAGTLGMVAAKLAGVPTRLHTVAGLPLLEARGAKRHLLDAVEKVTYACATKVYPNSLGLKEIILKEGFAKADKLKVLANGSSNGIDTDYFDPNRYSEQERTVLRHDLSFTPNDFVFVFVGRLVGDKGLNELVAAFLRLQAEAALPRKPKLLLVGPWESELDPLEENTMSEIERHPDIRSLGYQSDVRPYFAISQALVFPSYREGFPNVVMQAGAMGLPSIVSDINGCNEIIVEGKNGTIVPPKDADALFRVMKRFLVDDSYLEALKSKARHMIVSRYEQQVVWDAILEEYEGMVNV